MTALRDDVLNKKSLHDKDIMYVSTQSDKTSLNTIIFKV